MTIFVADRAAASFPVAQPIGGGQVCAARGTYEVTINPVTADTYELCKVPAGATILGGMFYCDDLDTGTETLDLDLGWKANGGSGTYDSVDADGLANMGTLTGDASAPNLATSVGLIYNLGGPHFGNGDFPTFTKETVIQVTAVTACHALTAGAMSCVIYYMTD